MGRKGFAFNADKPGMMTQSTDMFKAALSTVDVTFQNLDSSSEISISDVSAATTTTPIPTKVVEGLRKDGKKPSSMMADTTTANAQVRSLSETVRLDARTKLLNPKFYEGMLASWIRRHARNHQAPAQHDGLVRDRGGGRQLRL